MRVSRSEPKEKRKGEGETPTLLPPVESGSSIAPDEVLFDAARAAAHAYKIRLLLAGDVQIAGVRGCVSVK
jgi:hypothetical protein